MPLSYALSPLKPGSRSFKLANIKQESNSHWYSDTWGLKKDLPPNLVTQWSNILSQRSVLLTLTTQPISVSPSFPFATSKLLLSWEIYLWGGNLNHWSAVGSSFSFNRKGGTAGLLGIKRASERANFIPDLLLWWALKGTMGFPWELCLVMCELWLSLMKAPAWKADAIQKSSIHPQILTFSLCLFPENLLLTYNYLLGISLPWVSQLPQSQHFQNTRLIISFPKSSPAFSFPVSDSIIYPVTQTRNQAHIFL